MTSPVQVKFYMLVNVSIYLFILVLMCQFQLYDAPDWRSNADVAFAKKCDDLTP